MDGSVATHVHLSLDKVFSWSRLLVFTFLLEQKTIVNMYFFDRFFKCRYCKMSTRIWRRSIRKWDDMASFDWLLYIKCNKLNCSKMKPCFKETETCLHFMDARVQLSNNLCPVYVVMVQCYFIPDAYYWNQDFSFQTKEDSFSNFPRNWNADTEQYKNYSKKSYFAVHTPSGTNTLTKIETIIRVKHVGENRWIVLLHHQKLRAARVQISEKNFQKCFLI